MSLRGQVALLVSVAVLLTCGIMFAVNLTLDRRQTIEKSDDGLRLLSLYMAGQLSNRFSNVSRKADQLAQKVSEKIPSYSKEAYDLMEQYYAHDDDIYGGAISFDHFQFTKHQKLFCLILAKNAVTGAFDQARLPPDYDYTDPSDIRSSWFTVPKATGRGAWTLPFFDEDGGNIWMLTYSVPFTRNNVFTGTINVDVALTSPAVWMRELLADAPSEVTAFGTCFLTDGTGTLVSFDDTKAVEERRNIEEFLQFQDGEHSRVTESGEGEHLAVWRAKNNVDRSGDWMRVVRAPVGNTGWYL